MSACEHPLRSVLYVPGDNLRASEKIPRLPADAVILDLEDGVDPSKKDSARQNIKTFLKNNGGKGKYITVRVNRLDSEWLEDDISFFSDCTLDAIVFPKVETLQHADKVQALLNHAGYSDNIAVWFMIETPQGVLNAEQIASVKGRLECLVMGTSDLVKDLQAKHTQERLPILYSLSHCILAARAYGLSIVDGVHLNLSDEESFLMSCQQGADMGFDGKTVIHPKQIAGANVAFSPSDKEIEEAKNILKAYEQATRDGKGVTLVDGKLVEALHVENAKRLLKLANTISDQN